VTDPGSPQPAAPAAPELQFDRFEPTSDATSSATPSNVEGIVCAGCGVAMLDEYYSLRGKSICAKCRAAVEARLARSRTPKAFGKAFVFGLGGALAGAVVYYAVDALLGLQLSIITILMGWLVGRAIQKALPGGGMRRYQVLAVVLTYFAVGAAYLPFVIQGVMERDAAKRQDSTAVAAQQGNPAASSAAPSKGDVAQGERKDAAYFLKRSHKLVLLAFTLPYLLVTSDGGILSALIIAIGMYQAWRMTGAPAQIIKGPFRVGGNAVAAGTS